MSVYTKFAIIGAGGLGGIIADELLKKGDAVSVAILTRDETKPELQAFKARGVTLHQKSSPFQNLPARGKMVKLFCAIVGAAGSAFEVKIDDAESVSALKKAIWEEIKAKFIPDDKFRSVVASDLQPFLAKTEGGAWLDGAGAAAVALDERGHPQGCVQMDPTLWIKNVKYFGDNFQPGEGQVHVLVVVPGHARVDIGGTASRALKYKRTRWIINAQSFFLAARLSCQMIGVDIAVGAILSYSQHWKSKLDNMIEEAKDETPLQVQQQEMTDLAFAAEAQHQELTEHTSLLSATEAQRQPQQQQPSQSTKRNRGRGKRK
ncbi:unnamed protein product [Phytophthora lilii]|uniref:Unnamed protein product n=1 Tax=Phytophthora lilii TaxID=2077276 RepID=A0A9W7CQK7_9STRA|nr:unnamed protein product [Phytophthora lilii]